MSDPTPTSAEMYRAVLAAFAAATATVDADTRVPACPAWTVHELLAHQVHQLSGMCDGTFPLEAGLAALTAPTAAARAKGAREQQAWIDRGVAATRAAPVATLLADWSSLAGQASPSALAGLLPDVVHLFDLLGTSRATTHRDEPHVGRALEFWGAMADVRLRTAGHDGLRLRVIDGSDIGNPDAAVVVAGTGFELLRTITGRRARTQARALELVSGDPAALDDLALYGWRATALDEYATGSPA
jgi:hypothetical protein